ncbi:hypothetical protein [Oceanomicrobium pacificus]|uniref:Uncharacterized protein n=1 Tax=Oceanomicrobium pacificus TaxID=2692916 RepID=A0A6B0TZM9_9RHOB|nr:hypothetical protein [Oceanomicrobium pacificus]MXU66463.1 hypothetical protein [Oceanomicrobium pacificus]
MPLSRKLAIVFLLPLFGLPVQASDAVTGIETGFTSPAGVAERCVRITPAPGGAYSDKDLEAEAAYCAIDFYAAGIALCPKTWSTSPGMALYDLSEGPYTGDRDGFMREACKEGKAAKDLAADRIAKFKPTMNGRGTSATFSTSSLLYYHFSRYFDMQAKVPVAVWRSMDRQAHLDQVARMGLALTGGHARMNHEGWALLVAADERPESYSPTDELFTADRSQIYGALLDSPGHRYGPQLNGTRASGWGKGQNRDFQETPAFLALRANAPLAEAIEAGIAAGRRDPLIAKDLAADVPRYQIARWMQDLTEIVLLDFIFSQQDRIGNIDFEPYYHWVEAGELKSKKAKHHSPGDGDVPDGAMLIRHTRLNDNDAGGKLPYANFAKSTQMLEKMRHFPPNLYRRLIALDTDLQSGGPVFGWLSSSFGLTEAQVTQVVKNTALARGILQDACDAGQLRFDLDPDGFALSGEGADVSLDCAAP